MISRLLIGASAVALGSLAAPALAQHHHMPGMTMPEKPPQKEEAPAKPAQPAPEAMPPAHTMAMDHSGAQHMTMGMDHQMEHGGALGPYPVTRESSGTAWQPEVSEHMGLMSMSGAWTLMAHGVLNLV